MHYLLNTSPRLEHDIYPFAKVCQTFVRLMSSITSLAICQQL